MAQVRLLRRDPQQPRAAGRARVSRLLPRVPPAAPDISWQPRAAQRPWKTEEAFLQALAAAPPGKALVSSGLRFRTDLAAFGGPGLGLCADLLSAARPGDA